MSDKALLGTTVGVQLGKEVEAQEVKVTSSPFIEVVTGL